MTWFSLKKISSGKCGDWIGRGGGELNGLALWVSSKGTEIIVRAIFTVNNPDVYAYAV